MEHNFEVPLRSIPEKWDPGPETSTGVTLGPGTRECGPGPQNV